MKISEILNEKTVDFLGYDYVEAQETNRAIINHLVPKKGSKNSFVIDKEYGQSILSNLSKAESAISGLKDVPSQINMTSNNEAKKDMGLLILYQYFKIMGVIDYIKNNNKTNSVLEDRENLHNKLVSFMSDLTDRDNEVSFEESSAGTSQSDTSTQGQAPDNTQNQTIAQNAKAKATGKITRNSKKGAQASVTSTNTNTNTGTAKGFVDVSKLPDTITKGTILGKRKGIAKVIQGIINKLYHTPTKENTEEVLNKLFEYKYKHFNNGAYQLTKDNFTSCDKAIKNNKNLSDKEKETVSKYISATAVSRGFTDFKPWSGAPVTPPKDDDDTEETTPTIQPEDSKKRKELIDKLKTCVDNTALVPSKLLDNGIQDLHLAAEPSKISAVPSIYFAAKNSMDTAESAFNSIKKDLASESITLNKEKDGITLAEYESRFKDAKKSFDTVIKTYKEILEKAGVDLSKKDDSSSTKNEKVTETQEKVTDKIDRVDASSDVLSKDDTIKIVNSIRDARDNFDKIKSKDDLPLLDEYLNSIEKITKGKKLNKDIKDAIDEFKEDIENKKAKIEKDNNK